MTSESTYTELKGEKGGKEKMESNGERKGRTEGEREREEEQ